MDIHLYDLPIELLKEILKLLPFNQLLICKQVSKLWQSIINEFKFSHFSICDTYHFKELNFPDFKIINQNWSIKINDFDTFNSSKLNDGNHFSKLKSLCIYSIKRKKYRRPEINLSILIENLKCLENLNINGLSSELDVNINLNSLLSLSIDDCFLKLFLNTPNLINLKVDCYVDLQNLEYYNIKLLNLKVLNIKFILKFVNLEYLYIETIDEYYFITDPNYYRIEFLNRLQNLKVFSFKCDYFLYTMYELYLEGNYQNKFRSYIDGVDLAYLRKSHYNYSDLMRIYTEHADNLEDKMIFFNFLNYNLFNEQFNQIPFDLLRKFVNLRWFIINGNIDDEIKLIIILKYLSNSIKILEINNSFLGIVKYLLSFLNYIPFQLSALLGQQFFDEIPKLIPILDKLTFKKEKQKKYNYNFLFKFESIKSVNTDQNVSTEIVDRFISEYENFLSFKYLDGKQSIEYYRNQENNEIIIRKAKLDKLNDCLDEFDNLGINDLFESDLSDLEIGELF